MWSENKWVQELYDRNGDFLGIVIGPSMWQRVRDEVAPVLNRELERLQGPEKPENKEPLKDWRNLEQSWGFNYPVDYDVSCEICGNETRNWQEDDPRKFLLKAANIAGLVTFECQSCRARITKKHFKDQIVVESREPKS